MKCVSFLKSDGKKSTDINRENFILKYSCVIFLIPIVGLLTVYFGIIEPKFLF